MNADSGTGDTDSATEPCGVDIGRGDDDDLSESATTTHGTPGTACMSASDGTATTRAASADDGSSTGSLPERSIR